MRIHWVRFLFFVLVLTVFSAGNLYDAVAIGSLGLKPDLLLIATIFFAIHCATPDAVAASFVIGFAADLCGATMGPNMIAFGLLGSLFSQLQRVVLMKRILHQVTAIFIIAIAAGIITQLLCSLKMGQAAPQFVQTILGGAVYSAAAAPLIWLLFNTLSVWLGYYPQRYKRSGR